MQIQPLLHIIAGSESLLNPFQMEQSGAVDELIQHARRYHLGQPRAFRSDRTHGSGTSAPADLPPIAGRR